MTLVFLLILFLIIWPLLKIAITFYGIQKRARNPFGKFAASADTGRRKAGRARQNKKKITRDVGEYVEFEEISVTDSDSGSYGGGASQNDVHVKEQQIVDAEWEEITKQ